MKKSNSNKKIYIVITALLFIAVIVYLAQNQNDPAINGNDGRGLELTRVDAISHGHGLAIDLEDISKLYIATHNGLLVLEDDKDLYRIGQSQDDYMGFSQHPNDPRTLLTSGHQKAGGNIGFQISNDGGISWTKISDGINGPVDFHTMAVSPADPDQIYGLYQGKLQRSQNGGTIWEIIDSNINMADVISFTADPIDKNIVFAATTKGLYVSKDMGFKWDTLSGELNGGAVTTVAIDPRDAKKMISFSEMLGLAISNDGGEKWSRVSESFGGEAILYIAIAKKDPRIVYALSNANSIYKSIDKAVTWQKIR